MNSPSRATGEKIAAARWDEGAAHDGAPSELCIKRGLRAYFTFTASEVLLGAALASFSKPVFL